MKQLICDWLMMLLVVALLLVVAVTTSRGADAPRFRVDAPGHSDTRRFLVTQGLTADNWQPTTEVQPEVLFLTASWCVGPCQPVKADITAGRFKRFKVRTVDIDKEQSPIPIVTVPAFYWRTSDGRAWQYPPPGLPDNDPRRGYPGHEALIRMWEGTQPREKLRGVRLNSYESSYGAVTPRQQAMIDQAVRAGYSMDDIMNYARSKGLVK